MQWSWRPPDTSGALRVMTPMVASGRSGAVQEINFTASCRVGPFQSWDREKSALTGRNRRTLSVKGWWRHNASCSALHEGAGSAESGEWTMADGDSEEVVR